MGILTHEILLRKVRKEGKFMGRGGGGRVNWFVDHFLRRESMCSSLVMKRTKNRICSG
jgi:hypothetical protein